MRFSSFNRIYFIYVIAFLLTIYFLFWKCKFGYATLDEAFYPTIAYRFLQGDRILYDEWCNNQLSSLIIMPFLKAYIYFNDNLDGVYLYFRYVFTILNVAFSLVLYLLFRKIFSVTEAFFASFIFLIYAGYGLMVLSYNSIAIYGSLLFLVFLIDTDDSFKGWIKRFFSGFFLAVGVLGLPYLVFLYFIFFVVSVLFFICKVRDSVLTNIFCIKNMVGVSLGATFVFLLFVGYVFQHSSVENIILTLPQILNGDPAHGKKTLYQFLFGYFVRIVLGNNRNYALFSFYIILSIVCFFYYIDKNKIITRNIYLMHSGVWGLCLFLIYFYTDFYINSIFFILNIVGLLLFWKFENSKLRIIFWGLWIPGIVITYLEYLASNTGFSGIACYSIISSIASMFIITNVISNNINFFYKIPLVFFLSVTVLSCLFLRYTYVFWEDGGLNSLSEKISYGVSKGLVVTPDEKFHYDLVMEDCSDIRNMPPETRVLYIGDQILWMSGNQRCASYSPLCYSIATDRSILFEYYKSHPEMIADCVYIEFEYGFDLVNELVNNFGYFIDKRKTGWLLVK